MKILFTLIALSIMTLSHANADKAQTTCFASYSNTWLKLEIEAPENCLRCQPGVQLVQKVKVSLPIGPRGTFIAQVYQLKDTKHFRLTQGTYKKIGQPVGPFSGQWTQWFPTHITIYESHSPLYLDFNGESVDLKCQY